jgi:two-component system, LytTR family, response regulator
MIRALVVDDESVARRRVRRMLELEPDVTVIGECGDAEAAVDIIRTTKPDLVFLDVQMPGADGFEVIRAAGDSMPAVVFVTAFDHYALGAFEVHALDYLLKPFTRARFAQTVAHAREHLARRADRSGDQRLESLVRDLGSRSRYLSRFVVKADGRTRLIAADRVDWIEAADNYVVLHAGVEAYTVRDTLSRLDAELDPDVFVRIHRSTVVRLDRIVELLPSFHGDFVVVLRDGSRLAMSRTFRPRIEALLKRTL